MSLESVKRAVRERDGWRCTECGMTDEEHRRHYGKTLDVHRLVPGSGYTLDACKTVCRKCHARFPKRPNGLGVYPDGRVPMNVRLPDEGFRLLYTLRARMSEAAGHRITFPEVVMACLDAVERQYGLTATTPVSQVLADPSPSSPPN